MADRRLIDDTAVAFLQQNPKKNGSKAAERYDKYKAAKTVGEALRLGALKGDIPNDMQKGHLHLVDAAGAVIQAPPPAAPQPPAARSVGAATPKKRGIEAVAHAIEDSPVAKRQAVEVKPDAMPAAQPAQALEPEPPQPAARSPEAAVLAPSVPSVQTQGAASAEATPAIPSCQAVPQDAVPTPQGRTQPYEIDLSFANFDGKPVKFAKRAMGEAKKLLSERGIAETKVDGLEFTLKDRQALSKYAVTVRELNQDGKLYKDLQRLGLDASIDLEVSLPDEYPMSPPFVRVLYPQLTGGFVFNYGGICFEPLTEKGWAPSMTIPALCVSVKAILDHGDVRVAGVGNKELRTVQHYTEEGARKDHKYISSAHQGGDARTYQNLKFVKS